MLDLLDVSAVVRWLRSDVRLEAAAKAAEEHQIDGAILLALLDAEGGLERIGVTDVLDVARFRGKAAHFGQTSRPAKRSRSARASVPASPCDEPPAAAAQQEESVAKHFDTGPPPTSRTVVYASKPPDYLECAVCMASVMTEPHVIKGACMHSFCRECLLRVLRAKRECPKCKAKSGIPAPPHAEASLMLRNTDMCGVIESQRVHCPCGVLQVDLRTPLRIDSLPLRRHQVVTGIQG
jgi:hypothetical protein